MKQVPQSLRHWFLIHFLVDMIFAIPLLFAPEWTLSLMELPMESTATARLVGAALIGIGGNSLWMKGKDLAHFKTMLDLKVLWSGAAIMALGLELITRPNLALWLIFGTFAIFALLWNFYRFRLR